MKKLFILMLMAITFMAINAQNETVDRSLSYTDTWFLYPGNPSDSIQSGDSIWTYTIAKRTDTKTYAYFYVSADSVGGTAAPVTFYFQNKVFQDETFANLDTVTWSAGADTTFTFEVTTSDIADYWRLYMIGSTDSFNAYVKQFNGKFVK